MRTENRYTRCTQPVREAGRQGVMKREGAIRVNGVRCYPWHNDSAQLDQTTTLWVVGQSDPCRRQTMAKRRGGILFRLRANACPPSVVSGRCHAKVPAFRTRSRVASSGPPPERSEICLQKGVTGGSEGLSCTREHAARTMTCSALEPGGCVPRAPAAILHFRPRQSSFSHLQMVSNLRGRLGRN